MRGRSGYCRRCFTLGFFGFALSCGFFFNFLLAAGIFLRPHCGFARGLDCGGFFRRSCGRCACCRGPAIDKDEEAGNVFHSDCADDREYKRNKGDYASANIVEKRNQDLVGDEISNDTASIHHVRFLCDELYPRRVVLHNLQKRCGGYKEEAAPKKLDTWAKRFACDDSATDDNAVDRENPYGKSEKAISVIREEISEWANPVCAVGCWDLKIGCAPIVCEESSEGEERDWKKNPSEEPSFSAAEICFRSFRHFLFTTFDSEVFSFFWL